VEYIYIPSPKGTIFNNFPLHTPSVCHHKEKNEEWIMEERMRARCLINWMRKKKLVFLCVEMVGTRK